MCPVVKAQKGRHSTEKWEPVENRVLSIQTPVTSHGTQTGGSETAVHERTSEACSWHSCHKLLGSLPWQEATRQRGTMQGCVPLPGECQELHLTSGCSVPESRHCPPTVSPQMRASWPVTLLLALQPPLSTLIFTLAMPKRNTTAFSYTTLSTMLDDFLLSPSLLGTGFKWGIEGNTQCVNTNLKQ